MAEKAETVVTGSGSSTRAAGVTRARCFLVVLALLSSGGIQALGVLEGRLPRHRLGWHSWAPPVSRVRAVAAAPPTSGGGSDPSPAEEDPEVSLVQGEPRARPFEVCQLQGELEETLEIDECVVMDEGDLTSDVTNKQSRLLFGLQDGSELLTFEELESRAGARNMQVSEEVRQKAHPSFRLEEGRSSGAEQGRAYHMHFGAGRLGLGLVVPAVCGSGVPFAVVQRPKQTWTAVFDSGPGFVDILVNDRIVAPGLARLKTIKADEELPQASLVLSANPEELADLLRASTSFSCSLGAAMAKVIKPMMEQVPPRPFEEQPVLYACENDHQAVMRLKKELEGRVRVVDCMVDRVCMGRTITSDAIHIEAEPWRGSLVVLDPSVQQRVPFCKSLVKVPQSQLEADYYSERKFSLVNGMHTVISFMTLRGSYDSSVLQEYVLLKHDQMTVEQKREVQAWVVTRIAQLVEKYGIENIMQWHGCSTEAEVFDELLDYAYEVLDERFSKTDDVVSRVLGGGVGNRWLTRMRPSQLWLEKRVQLRSGSEVVPETAVDRLLVHSGFGNSPGSAESKVRGVVTSLLRESRKFCTREIEIINKDLIRMQREFGGKKNSPFVVAAIQVTKERQKQEAVEEEIQVLNRAGPVALLFNLNGTVVRPITSDLLNDDSGLNEPVQPAPHCRQMLQELQVLMQNSVVKCALATDTPSDAVDYITGAAGLADCFVTEGIHSASSDFEAPRLKPDPSVYIKAGEWTEVPMSQAIAVDSSPEGIMAASRAGVSLIIGYIGTKFDSQNELYEFANQLLRPGGSDRGAALVIDDLRDISPIVAEFANSCTSEHWQGDPAQLAAVCEGNAFLEFYTPIVEETAAP